MNKSLDAYLTKKPSSTNTLKFNDNRGNRKMPLWISRRSGTFLFQKLECNREKQLYCGYSTVFDEKKRPTILSK